MTKYARDEFDRVPETPTRQGVHRAAAESPRRSLGPVLAVGALALAVGLVAFLFLPKSGFNAAGRSSAVAVEQPASPVSSAAPDAGSPAATSQSQGSVSQGTESPSAAGAPSDEAVQSAPSPKASPETATVDKSQPVAVYNATGTAGLANRVGVTVASDGWTPGPVANWSGARQASSVIFYNGPDQKANAEALGSLLSIPTLVNSADIDTPLVVVLGPGFK